MKNNFFLLSFLYLMAPCMVIAQTPDESELKIVENTLNKLFPNNFKIENINASDQGNGNKLLSGTMSLMGSSAVQVNCMVSTQERKLKEINAIFPPNAVFSLDKIGSLCQGDVSGVLPLSVRTNPAGIRIMDFNLMLQPDGKSVQTFTFNLQASEWDFMNYGSFKMQNMRLLVNYSPASTPKVSGTLSGDVSVGAAQFNLSSNIPQSSKDWELKANYQGGAGAISLSDILNSIGGQELSKNIFYLSPNTNISNINIPQFSLTAKPGSKEVSIESESAFLFVSGSDGKLGGYLGYKPTGDFSLGSVSSSLSWLDGMTSKLSNLYVVIGNRAGDKNGLRFSSGITLAAKIDLPAEIQEVLNGKNQNLQISGNMSSLTDFRLEANTQLNSQLGSGIELKEVGLGIKSSATEKLLYLNGKMLFPVDSKTKILFGIGGGADVSRASVQVSLDMEAVNGDNNSKAEWREPFGIPYIGISRLGGTVGLSATTLLDKLALRGDIALGKSPQGNETDKRIKGALDLNLDVRNPLSSTLKASLNEVSIAAAIEAFSPGTRIDGSLRSILSSGIKDLSADIRPADGFFQVGGNIDIFGKKGFLDILIDKTGGIAAKGEMEPIEVKLGNLTLFAIKGSQSNNPNFSINLTNNNPALQFDASIKVLGISSSGAVAISKDGFDITVENNLANGLGIKANLKGSDFTKTEGITASVELKADIFGAITSELTQFIKNASGEATQKIQATQDKLKEAKKHANDVEKFFLDLGDGFLSGINQIQGKVATAGMFLVKAVGENAIAVKSIKFEGGANQLGAGASFAITIEAFKKTHTFNAKIQLDATDVSSVAKSIANQIGDAFLDAFNFLEGEWNGMKSSLSEFANKFAAGVEKTMRAVADGFNQFAQGVANILQEFKVWWDGPNFSTPTSGGTLPYITPEIEHFEVRFNHIKAIKADDGDDSELEMYGAVYVETLSSQFTVPSGTNVVAWATNKNTHQSLTAATPISNSHTKHFYIPAGANAPITMHCFLWEDDNSGHSTGSDFFKGSLEAVNIASVQTEQTFVFQVTEQFNKGQNTEIKDAGSFFNAAGSFITGTAQEAAATVSGSEPSILEISFTVKRIPKPSPDEMRAVIRSGDIKAWEALLAKGANARANGLDPLTEAISSRKVEMVEFFLANNIRPNTAHLNSVVNTDIELARKLMLRGAAPDATTLEAAIKKQDKAMTAAIFERGVNANLEQFKFAASQKNYVLAGLILDKGAVSPTQAELSTAVDGGDIALAKMIVAKNVKADVNMLNKSISSRNRALFDVLLPTVQPDNSSLNAAQDIDDIEVFKIIIEKGVRCSDDNLRKAMDKNNDAFTMLCFENGASANSGMTHALSKPNRKYIDMSLRYGADANAALPYAVKTNDLAFATQLISAYNANGDKLLQEAFTAKKIEFARIALTKGNANPNTHLAKASDDNMLDFTNLFLDYNANPNLAMNGAIKNKQVELLTRLIQMGADVSNPEYLVASVQHRSFQMVKLLVDAGANPNPGMAPAVANDDFNIIQYLLSNGASAKGHLATPACNNKVNTVKLLLQYDGDPNEGMKCATEKGWEELTIVLLSAGASPHGYMATPARSGQMGIVQQLVIFGANPNEGLPASVEGNQFYIAEFLLKNGATPKDLVKVAATANAPKMVRLLCEYGDNPEPGMMPAAQLGHVEVAMVLVEFGVDPKPYKYIRASVENNRSAMVYYFIKQGANSRQKAENDITLLHIAAGIMGGHPTVDVLLRDSAEVNAVETVKGNTPLHIAVRLKKSQKEDNMPTVELLVNAGADINAINNMKKNGITVRQYARPPYVKYLADKGAFVLVKKAREAGGKGGPVNAKGDGNETEEIGDDE